MKPAWSALPLSPQKRTWIRRVGPRAVQSEHDRRGLLAGRTAAGTWTRYVRLVSPILTERSWSPGPSGGPANAKSSRQQASVGMR